MRTLNFPSTPRYKLQSAWPGLLPGLIQGNQPLCTQRTHRLEWLQLERCCRRSRHRRLQTCPRSTVRAFSPCSFDTRVGCSSCLSPLLANGHTHPKDAHRECWTKQRACLSCSQTIELHCPKARVLYTAFRQSWHTNSRLACKFCQMRCKNLLVCSHRRHWEIVCS